MALPERSPRQPERRATIDVAALPPGAFGYRSLMWWGTAGLMLIEGTAFVLAIAAYFYLAQRMPAWPPPAVPAPSLTWGTVNVVILLASAVPNQLTKRAAERVDLRAVQIWLVVCLAFGVAFNVVRVLEFMSLNVTWYHDAYGSIVWMLLSLHTVHIAADVVDSAVLTVLMVRGPVEERRFVDVSENALYWYFVVFTWIPIYGVLYWAPRVL